MFKIKGATKWQDASASLDIYVLFKFVSPKSQVIIEHLAISFKLYELDPSISSISVVLTHEMGVFTYSNTSVGSGGLFMHISFKMLVIVVVFTQYVSTIAFIPVTLFISEDCIRSYGIIISYNVFAIFFFYL